jgi:hypothetical protein
MLNTAYLVDFGTWSDIGWNGFQLVFVNKLFRPTKWKN